MFNILTNIPCNGDTLIGLSRVLVKRDPIKQIGLKEELHLHMKNSNNPCVYSIDNSVRTSDIYILHKNTIMCLDHNTCSVTAYEYKEDIKVYRNRFIHRDLVSKLHKIPDGYLVILNKYYPIDILGEMHEHKE